MPLVRTPMIAPTSLYDRFPAATPDEAAGLLIRAIKDRPKRINTPVGTLGELTGVFAPKLKDAVLHQAYRVFPDSASAKGEKKKEQPEETAQPASNGQDPRAAGPVGQLGGRCGWQAGQPRGGRPGAAHARHPLVS